MKKITIISLMALAFVGTGCNNFLEEAPILSQSTEITLSTYAGLNSAIAGAYAPLASTTWYGAGMILEAEMRSGNGKKPTLGAFDSGRYGNPYNMSYSPSSTSGLWGLGYYVISAVNNVIDNLEGKEGGDVTAKDINNLKAEALFLRALSHFDMVRLYSQPYSYQPDGLGVPVVLHTDPTAKPARNTTKEVYEQVIADLKEAESLMSDDYKRAGVADAKATVTKPAIQALLSRVYLNMQQWQNAADYATKVINNSNFRMWTSAEYPNVWAMDIPAEGEIIFELYGNKSNAYDGYWEGPQWMTSPQGYADVAVSNDLVGLYSASDVRTAWQTDPEGPGLYWTYKYAGKGKATPDLSNVVILRLSEMYLNRAEAIANGASVSGASVASDLQQITSNRNAADYAAPGKEDVYTERRKELAFEGHFWFDLARLQRGITRVDYTGDVTNQNVAFPSYLFALPIPKRELDVNENLVPNDGYTK